MAFKKSSACTTASCVEVEARQEDGGARMRDSKDPDGLVHTYTPEQWAEFLAGAKAGDFNLPVN